MQRMTQTQFDALAQLLRLRDGAAREAARLHLMEGLSAPESAAAAGLSYRAAWQAIKRATDGLALAQIATGRDAAKKSQKSA